MKKVEMPSMSLAKRMQEDQARRDEALVETHTSTGPLRLEKRRRMAFNGVKSLKKFVLTLRTQLRAAQAEELEIEKWEKENPPSVICKKNNLTEEQEVQRRVALRSQRVHQLGQLELMIMDYNSRADMIDSNLLNFDALTVRMVKTKKNNKKGMFRNTVAMSMFDIASMVEVLCQNLRPDLYPPATHEEELYEPEDDTDDLVDDDESDEEGEETPKTAKGKNGARAV